MPGVVITVYLSELQYVEYIKNKDKCNEAARQAVKGLIPLKK